MQEPVRVTLGERYVWKGSGAKRQYVSTSDEMMYIPLLDTLQSMLKSDDVIAEVNHKHSLYHNHFGIVGIAWS